MRIAIGIGSLIGVATPLVAAALVALGITKCMDSPAFLNPQPLAWAGAGVGLLAAGAVLRGSAQHRGVAVIALAVGVVFLALALAGPPYHSCAQYQGPFR